MDLNEDRNELAQYPAYAGVKEKYDTATKELHAAIEDNISIGKRGVVKRVPVTYRYDAIWPEFLKLMANIAGIADGKYAHLGGVFNYTKVRLSGEAGPINHIYEHLREYREGVPYDNHESGDLGYHLAAIAYNAMMEWYYLRNYDQTAQQVPSGAEVAEVMAAAALKRSLPKLVK